ncbi:unnamed protein product [Prunus armeniaca]|uniref:Uncharacterized protein n=1 Tax=Prunus armeniaca TaxID=36596 RepID=A0A6J5VP96_PRUAR|nr:unnamed protein product [Prunus armeniaca]
MKISGEILQRHGQLLQSQACRTKTSRYLQDCLTQHLPKAYLKPTMVSDHLLQNQRGCSQKPLPRVRADRQETLLNLGMTQNGPGAGTSYVCRTQL